MLSDGYGYNFLKEILKAAQEVLRISQPYCLACDSACVSEDGDFHSLEE